MPPFQEWLEGSRNLRQGVVQGLHGFLELIESGDEGLLPGREVYFDFGRGELRARRSIDAVLTAYRIAHQSAWRTMSEIGHAAGLEPQTLYRLAEALFAYMDRMSSATAEGFAYERSVRAGERRDRRRRLVELLLRTPPAPAAELARDAAAVGWRLAPRLAVIAFPDERVTRMAARLPADAPGARSRCRRPARRGSSWSPTTAASTCCSSPTRPCRPRSPRTSSVRSARCRTSAGRAWWRPWARGCATRARSGPSPRSSHVHAQTVRYRVGRLRELLGERMASPEGRLELELALRARLLASS